LLLGPIIWGAARRIFFLTFADERLWLVGRYTLGAVLVSITTLLAHRFLPAGSPPWRQILPGAIAMSLLWLAVAGLFTLYLDYFSTYASTYGGLAGVVITLLFFDISALLFIFGAELNAAITRAQAPLLDLTESA